MFTTLSHMFAFAHSRNLASFVIARPSPTRNTSFSVLPHLFSLPTARSNTSGRS